jgi:GH15 family glucan-1,4-alpha-glucosidase
MNLNKTNYGLVIDNIKDHISNTAVLDGHFVKYIGNSEVDASLLGLSTPYAVVDPSNLIMESTVEKILFDLNKGGGIHRYSTDTYYGGGEWILLTAWLGWYYVQVGQIDAAKETLKWIEEQANSQSELPEQISATLNDESFVIKWRKRWGEIASPLLWSHAMYIILYSELGKKE